MSAAAKKKEQDDHEVVLNKLKIFSHKNSNSELKS